MRRFKLPLLLLLSLLSLWGANQPLRPLYAQEDSCTAALPYLFEVTSEQVCREINDNWVCYGKAAVNANPSGLRFTAPADRQPLEIFTDIGPQLPWGLVLMRVIDAKTQTPIDMIVFGDLGVQSLADATFALAAGSGQLLCNDTPSGLLMQTPSGRQGAVKINNIEIILGSTAFVTINSTGELTIANIEGNVTVVLPGAAPLAIPENSQIRVAAAAPTLAIGPEPSPYVNSAVIRFLTNDPAGLRRIGNPNRGDPSPEAQVPACGGEIEFGETLEGETFTLGQECIYTFTAALNSVATINMNTEGGDLDPWLNLRAPDLTLLSHNNDIGENDLNSRLCNVRLPTAVGVYTIVARAAGNDSVGPFRLQLEGQSACEPPEPRCEVAAEALNLRSGPGLNYAPLQILPQGAQLRVLGGNDAPNWLYVEALSSKIVGWVSADSRLTLCEELVTPTIVATPTPPTVTPTVTPTPSTTTTPLTATPTSATPTTGTPGTLTPTPTQLTLTTGTPTSATLTPATPTGTGTTPTPPTPECPASALQKKYGLSPDDLASKCPVVTPPPGTVATPTAPPAAGTKAPNVIGP